MPVEGTPVQLRTAHWYGGQSRDNYIHRSWMKRGLPDDVFSGRPMIGICNSASELAPCNQHLDDLVEHVKRGVWESGGVPFEFPVMSLGETQIQPTSMLLRNLMAMDVEESIRGNPIDAVVLLAGCDKTTPAMVMGAASVDLPALMITGGPMLTGRLEGRALGSATDMWRMSEEVRAGTLSEEDFIATESVMTRSAGHCNPMGTASTMASMVEALGFTLPDNAAIPAPDARRRRLAHLSGRRIVEMVHEDLRPSAVLTRPAFENAIKVLSAVGGSTNAVIHLLAIAGRVGVDLTLDDFDRIGSRLPLLANVMPAGKFLMEDFFEAGGIPAVMAELSDILDGDALAVTGQQIREHWAGRTSWNREVIRPMTDPIMPEAGIVVLRGNLCPQGAVVKPSAASPELLEHCGPALVFDTIEDFKARIDDPDLDVTAETVMVLRGCGPRGYPGMPEVGNMPLPAKLLAQGVTDMVRISDARMSGTAYGTVVLHTAPESAVGGPLALVLTGDMITLDVPGRSLTLDIDDAELDRRRAEWQEPPPVATRGWYRLYIDHVTQADTGCDLDFLIGSSGSTISRESH
ncbi:IlvD/Edd family dehydratase [Ilumatobacter sp.]|uniref:IlvD/Edd family dehydratase n=1 Tax=Ilumatobacter sp. TaxID=1967498 RepID=UPI003751AF93